MNEIKWGIIGCGDVTEKKSGPAFSKVAGSSLQAVMRRDAAKAKDYATRHKVPTWYDNAGRLINDPDVDAIYVATPPSSHEEYAIAAIKAGKPVYIEKPMTTDAASAKRICEAAKNYQVKCTVAHYRRELPIFRKIKELIDSGSAGKIQIVQLQLLQPIRSQVFDPGPNNWRIDPAISGGGLFHDLAPHQLDLLYHFFGQPSYYKGVSLNQGKHYEADDTVAGTMVFENNVIANCFWSFTVPEQEAKDECCIIGSEGTLRFGIFKMDKLTVTKSGREEIIRFDPVEHVQQPMIGKVVEYFSGRGPNPCTPEEGLAIMQIMDAFTQK